MLNPYMEAWQIRELVVKRELKLREVAEFFNQRVAKLNPKFNAFMTTTPERALADAERLQHASADEIAKMPLYGVPYSLKDLTWTKDIRTTMGSKNYENFMPPADSETTIRARNAGGLLLGKTTTPEFGGRPTTEGGLCPPARNPWNPAHTAGGSSGGAAAAVSSGMGPIAEGSDGGGSIRIPSSCCGTVGLKPARGRISFSPVSGEAWAGFATSGPLPDRYATSRCSSMYSPARSSAILTERRFLPNRSALLQASARKNCVSARLGKRGRQS